MKRTQMIKEIFEWIKYLGGAFIFALIVNNVVIVNATVVSASMENTIMTDSRVIGTRLGIGELNRFDIIAFEFPDDRTSTPFVKRIIGLPGETVEIRQGLVYINGSDIPLDDSFVKGEPRGNHGPFVVPADSYFVLGDNRNNSHDSKDWINPFVSRDMILGRVHVKIFPTPRILQ